MSCLTDERIQQWVDHELDPVSRRAAGAHLEDCDLCRRRVRDVEEVVEAADRLPLSIEPERDLWPEIEARLTQPGPVRRHGFAWQQLVAAAAMLVLGVLIGMRWRQELAPTGTQVQTQASEPVADADYMALAGEVEGLREQLQLLVADRGDQFDEPTLAAVNETLATLHRADLEMARAIESDPDNQGLRAMRASSVKREAHVLADLMVALNGASMVGIEPTT